MSIRILLADDHVLVRQGLRVLLEQAGMVVVGEAADGPEALRLAHTHAPEVAMPHVHGLETARRLRETVPQTKSMLLTMHTDEPYVCAALQAGAVGYVVKTQAAADIVQAIHTVVQGGRYVSPWVTTAVVQAYVRGTPLLIQAQIGDVIKQSCGCTKRPPAKSWWVQKLSADLTAD